MSREERTFLKQNPNEEKTRVSLHLFATGSRIDERSSFLGCCLFLSCEIYLYV